MTNFFSLLCFIGLVAAYDWHHCDQLKSDITLDNWETKGVEARECLQLVVDHELEHLTGDRRRIEEFRHHFDKIHWERMEKDEAETPEDMTDIHDVAHHAKKTATMRWVAQMKENSRYKDSNDWCEGLEKILADAGLDKEDSPCHPMDDIPDKWIDITINIRALYEYLAVKKWDGLDDIVFFEPYPEETNERTLVHDEDDRSEEHELSLEELRKQHEKEEKRSWQKNKRLRKEHRRARKAYDREQKALAEAEKEANKLSDIEGEIDELENGEEDDGDLRRRLSGVSTRDPLCKTWRSTVMDGRDYWNLDWLDDSHDHKFYQSDFEAGEDVELWILDDGVDVNHPEFNGRASWVSGSDTTLGGSHGTHVAGTAAGLSTGVAYKATIKAYRALGGGGSTLQGMRLAAAYKRAHPEKKMVINMSIQWTTKQSFPAPESNNALVRELKGLGVIVVIAAGNHNDDASGWVVASDPWTVIVGNAQSDGARFPDPNIGSNYGPLIDIWAPGTHIWSAVPSGQYARKTGTSMASPLVAGVFASMWGQNLQLSAEQIRSQVIGNMPNYDWSVDGTRSTKAHLIKRQSPNCGARQFYDEVTAPNMPPYVHDGQGKPSYDEINWRNGCHKMQRKWGCEGGIGARTVNKVIIQESNGTPGLSQDECQSRCAQRNQDGCCQWYDNGRNRACYFFADAQGEGTRFPAMMYKPFMHWNVGVRNNVAAARCENSQEAGGVIRNGGCNAGEYLDTQCDMSCAMKTAKCGNQYCCVRCPNAPPAGKTFYQLPVAKYHVPVGKWCNKRRAFHHCDNLAHTPSPAPTCILLCLGDPNCDGFTFNRANNLCSFMYNCVEPANGDGVYEINRADGSATLKPNVRSDVAGCGGLGICSNTMQETIVKCMLNTQCDHVTAFGGNFCQYRCGGVTPGQVPLPGETSTVDTYECTENVPMPNSEIQRMCQWK